MQGLVNTSRRGCDSFMSRDHSVRNAVHGPDALNTRQPHVVIVLYTYINIGRDDSSPCCVGMSKATAVLPCQLQRGSKLWPQSLVLNYKTFIKCPYESVLGKYCSGGGLKRCSLVLLEAWVWLPLPGNPLVDDHLAGHQAASPRRPRRQRARCTSLHGLMLTQQPCPLPLPPCDQCLMH